MWRWLTLAIAGCATPHDTRHPLAEVAAVRCDRAAWRAAALTTRRGWLMTGAAEPALVTVLDQIGDGARIATVSRELVVTRRVRVVDLGRAVVEPVVVSPEPDTPGDPAVELKPGYPLIDGPGPWLALDPSAATREGIAITGYVPAAASGRSWDDAAAVRFTPYGVAHDEDLLAAPRPDAPVRMHLTRQVELELELIAGQPGWYAATAHLRHAIVRGFVAVPDGGRRVYDFSGDRIESGDEDFGGGVTLPAEVCLYDVATGEEAGMVLAPLRLSSAEWRAAGFVARLRPAWGPSLYTTQRPPLSTGLRGPSSRSRR